MGLIYCHPGTSIPEFSKQFWQLLLDNITGYKENCLFGDIYINPLNGKVISVKNYFNQIHGFGLTYLISIPTRVNNLGGTFIDHF